MPMLLSHIIWFFVDYNLYLILFWNTALNRPGFVRRDIEKGKKSHDHIYLDKIQNSTSMFHENTPIRKLGFHPIGLLLVVNFSFTQISHSCLTWQQLNIDVAWVQSSLRNTFWRTWSSSVQNPRRTDIIADA